MQADSMNKSILGALLFAYVCLPLALEFTSLPVLGYRSLPNEHFRAAQHLVVEKRRACRADECDDVPVAWIETASGQLFRSSDFDAHRRAEAKRLSWTWLVYGLIGCLGVAVYFRHFNPQRQPAAVALSVGSACMAALLIYWTILP